jgi:hypothetical protein
MWRWCGGPFDLAGFDVNAATASIRRSSCSHSILLNGIRTAMAVGGDSSNRWGILAPRLAARAMLAESA